MFQGFKVAKFQGERPFRAFVIVEGFETLKP